MASSCPQIAVTGDTPMPSSPQIVTGDTMMSECTTPATPSFAQSPTKAPGAMFHPRGPLTDAKEAPTLELSLVPFSGCPATAASLQMVPYTGTQGGCDGGDAAKEGPPSSGNPPLLQLEPSLYSPTAPSYARAYSLCQNGAASMAWEKVYEIAFPLISELSIH